jgi:hypothetical protein
MKREYLAWDSSAMKHRTLIINCLIERRAWMNVDRIQPFISFEEFLPKRSQ